MPDYSKPLGDVIKSARKRMDLTQNEVADSIDVDVRTIINIENYNMKPMTMYHTSSWAFFLFCQL